MLNIERFQCNPLAENCYVVSDSTLECVIIDCGAYYEEERSVIVDYIRQNGLKPKHLLVTHAHADHNLGNNTIFDTFALRPELSGRDEQLMTQIPEQAASFGFNVDYKLPAPDHYFDEKEVITFGDHTFSIIETPGHSAGSVCFYCEEEKALFTGDTLFRGSIGRTDFMGGSMFQIIQSLRCLCQLPDDVKVYPGHGSFTSIGNELASNPYLDR